jgi:hypothetical protein
METDRQAPPHAHAMSAEQLDSPAAQAENDHGKAAWDDIDVRSIALVVGVGSVLVFVAIVAVQVIYYRYSANEYVQKVERVPTTEVNEVLAEQRERLATAGEGADFEKGEKSIPIDKAMTAVLADYQARQKNNQDQQDGETADAAENTAAENTAAGDGTAEETATR